MGLNPFWLDGDCVYGEAVWPQSLWQQERSDAFISTSLLPCHSLYGVCLNTHTSCLHKAHKEQSPHFFPAQHGLPAPINCAWKSNLMVHFFTVMSWTAELPGSATICPAFVDQGKKSRENVASEVQVLHSYFGSLEVIHVWYLLAEHPPATTGARKCLLCASKACLWHWCSV